MKPVLQALVLADRVYEDRNTGKKIISGTFNTLLFRKKTENPTVQQQDGTTTQLVQGGTQAGSPSAYISITDAEGELPLVLRYVDLESDKIIFHATFTVTSNNRLGTLEFVAPLPPLPTPHAGVFALELLYEEEPLGSLRITVQELT